jgi:two-component system chemotaxis sensor kinase CheA
LRAELLNDFYSEDDEHLHAIRDALVALESSVGRAQVHHTVLQQLFRSFHSFKGISAIVGLKPAEMLAHGAEDYLRDLSRGTTMITASGVDLLMLVTHRLEQVVRAHRENHALPEIDSLLKQVSIVTPTRPEAMRELTTRADEPVSDVATDVEVAKARGAVVWQCTFVPTPDLDRRGVNVNAVRARLSEVGEILRANPEVRPGGTIAFEVVVSFPETLSDLEMWEKDGVTFQPLDQATGLSSNPAAEPQRPLAEMHHNPFVAPSHVVRVDLGRLDELMRITGDLVIQRSRLEQQLTRRARGDAVLDIEEMEEVNDGLARSLRDLRESIML